MSDPAASDFRRIPVIDVSALAGGDAAAVERVAAEIRRASIGVGLVFYDPDYDTNVECLPNCASADNPVRYPPIVAGDYITARYDGTYSYRQPTVPAA